MKSYKKFGSIFLTAMNKIKIAKYEPLTEPVSIKQ